MFYCWIEVDLCTVTQFGFISYSSPHHTSLDMVIDGNAFYVVTKQVNVITWPVILGFDLKYIITSDRSGAWACWTVVVQLGRVI